jgi:hypothetical protein
MDAVRVGPVAGIPIVHELHDGIQLERSSPGAWRGTSPTAEPIVISHALGDATPARMRPVLEIPPWCTFHLDERGEPASMFHAVFGEVDRLLRCDVPGTRYAVRYGTRPRGPVIALQSELAAYSFALAARGVGLIAHSCAFISPQGEGVLCPGVSGTGKTTLARLLAAADPTLTVLTDDRAIVTLDERGPRLWGSPWPGAAQVTGEGSAPLTTVVFIRHGSSVARRNVAPAEGFRRIVNTLSMPLWEPARCGRALELIDAIVTRGRLIEATYPPDVAGARWLVSEIDSAAAVEVA